MRWCDVSNIEAAGFRLMHPCQVDQVQLEAKYKDRRPEALTAARTEP